MTVTSLTNLQIKSRPAILQWESITLCKFLEIMASSLRRTSRIIKVSFSNIACALCILVNLNFIQVQRRFSSIYDILQKRFHDFGRALEIRFFILLKFLSFASGQCMTGKEVVLNLEVYGSNVLSFLST